MDVTFGGPQQVVDWLSALGLAVGGFATLASMTPNKSDDKIVQFVLDLVNTLGLNVGQARNKDEDGEA